MLTCCDLPEALKKIVKCLMSVWKSDHVPICVLVSFSKISLFVCLFFSEVMFNILHQILLSQYIMYIRQNYLCMS